MKLEDFNKQLEGTGRILLHTDASNFQPSKKYKFSCSNNHIVEQRANDVLRKIHVLNRPSKGCPECHKEELEKQSLEVTQNHLPEGFKILDSYRKEVERKKKNNIKIYQIECNRKHIFEKESGHLKNLSCTVCSEQVYIGQERTRKIFEVLFNTKFPPIRPDWLKNPNTKRNLELDGFNPDLNIAFEFQGRQHFDTNTEYQDDYLKQSKRDELKRELCQSFGVNLIEIKQPPQYQSDKFIQNVVEQIKQQIGIINYPSVDFDIKKNQFNFSDITFDQVRPNVKLFLDFLTDESPIKEYTCLTTDFHTYEDKISMCCPVGHHYETTVAEFKRNVLGKKGRDIPCITCYEEKNIVNTKIDLQYCKQEGLKYGLTLLSTEYKNVNQKLSWKKVNGEVVELTFRQIQRSKTKEF